MNPALLVRKTLVMTVFEKVTKGGSTTESCFSATQAYSGGALRKIPSGTGLEPSKIQMSSLEWVRIDLRAKPALPYRSFLPPFFF